MKRYLSLVSLTEQGRRDVRQSVERAAEFRSSVEAAGGNVLAQYWTLGSIDGCVIFEAPDEETATTLLLALGQVGNVRSQTLRAYDAAEFSGMAARL